MNQSLLCFSFMNDYCQLLFRAQGSNNRY